MSAPDASGLQSIRESFDSYSADDTVKSDAVHASIERLLSHQSAMTVDLLRVSSIGKSLNQLRKKLPTAVQTQANQLLEAWRKLAQAATQPAAAAAAAAVPAASTPVKTPSSTTVPASASSSPPTPSPPTSSPESETRKRKAEGEAPTETARPEKKGSLAKSVIASIDYPLPTTTPPTGSAASKSFDTKSVPLPGADAFFSKPPSASPPTPMTAVAAARAAIKAQQAPVLSQRLSPVDEFRQRIRIQICKCFTAEAMANAQATIKADGETLAAAAGDSASSTGDSTPMSPTAVTPTSSSTPTFAFVDPSLAEFDSQVVETALEIEALVFTHAGKDIGKAYRDKSRDVMSHLRNSNNKELSVKVLTGDISVDKLITAPYTELASAALKRDRQKAHEWEMAERRSDLTPHVTVTDAFRCGKCRQRSTSFYQMQTRSADEPMTTFIRCLTPGCGNRWRC